MQPNAAILFVRYEHSATQKLNRNKRFRAWFVWLLGIMNRTGRQWSLLPVDLRGGGGGRRMRSTAVQVLEVMSTSTRDGVGGGVAGYRRHGRWRRRNQFRGGGGGGGGGCGSGGNIGGSGDGVGVAGLAFHRLSWTMAASVHMPFTVLLVSNCVSWAPPFLPVGPTAPSRFRITVIWKPHIESSPPHYKKNRNISHFLKLCFHEIYRKKKKKKKQGKLTGSGSEKSAGKCRNASRFKRFSDGNEQIRRNMNISSNVFVDQSLVFQLHPLRWSERSSNTYKPTAVHASTVQTSITAACRTQNQKQKTPKCFKNQTRQKSEHNSCTNLLGTVGPTKQSKGRTECEHWKQNVPAFLGAEDRTKLAEAAEREAVLSSGGGSAFGDEKQSIWWWFWLESETKKEELDLSKEEADVLGSLEALKSSISATPPLPDRSCLCKNPETEAESYHFCFISGSEEKPEISDEPTTNPSKPTAPKSIQTQQKQQNPQNPQNPQRFSKEKQEQLNLWTE